MTIQKGTTVGEVAAVMPGALPVFQELRIDYCCGGKKLFADALNERNVRVDEFVEWANKRVQDKTPNPIHQDFTQMSPAVLTSYIEDTHHDHLRRALPEIDGLLIQVLGAHGRNHVELFEVYKLFGRLKSELTQHLIKEETMLFPALIQDAARDCELVDIIVREHEGAGELLEAMRSVSFDYNIPKDACATYRRTYEMLQDLEEDLHQHIHLENNILLKEGAE